MTRDDQAAAAFYHQVVGWQTADAGIPGMRYTLLSAGGVVIAGLMTLPQAACDAAAGPGWIGYIGATDVNVMGGRLQQAGGTLQRPAEDIPGVGRFAVVADQHGASFDLFRSNEAEQAPQPPVGIPGTVGWHGLLAGDLGSAWAFYSGLFGWTKDLAMDLGAMGSCQLFATGGEAIGAMMSMPPKVPKPSWLYHFNVEAIDAALARVTAAGVQVLSGPTEVPGPTWTLQCPDPQGAAFALVAPRR
jgi:predicted enzyme related to lactoylglutathione lyase